MTAALSSITGRFGVIAKTYDVVTLDAFIASQRFLELFGSVPAQKKPSVFTAYHKAREACLSRKPVAAPKSVKVDWKQPGAIERFKRLWLKHGGNKDLIAREMPMTPGAVGMAYSRFIRHGATATYTPVKNRNRKPQDAREPSRLPLVARPKSESVAPAMAAA
jgi:hypothetical protein